MSDIDLPLAALFAGWAMADEVQRRIAADGMGDVRFADGFVFQHLVPGPLAIGALADRMAVTQQAASKAVADLERRGYVQRASYTSPATSRSPTARPPGSRTPSAMRASGSCSAPRPSRSATTSTPCGPTGRTRRAPLR